MRIAVAGLGHAALDLHLPALAAIPDARVVGGCDPDPKRRQEALTRWRTPTFADCETMLEETRPDAVIIATPPSSHAQLCLLSLDRGAHVVCEKPFVSSVAEADQVIAAAARAGRQVAVNHEFREMPIFRSLIDRVRERGAGDLRFVQAWQLTDMPPGSEQGWRGSMTHRTLFEAGVHLIDLILALFGERPVSVQASMASGSAEGDGDALVTVALAFSGGRFAHLLQNRVCKGERQYFEVRADAVRASFRASFGGRARVTAGLFRSVSPHVRLEYGASGLAWKEEGPRRTRIASNPRNPNVVGTRAVLQEALSAFAASRESRAGARAARDVLEIVAASYRSAETGERIHLDAQNASRLRNIHMGLPQLAASYA